MNWCTKTSRSVYTPDYDMKRSLVVRGPGSGREVKSVSMIENLYLVAKTTKSGRHQNSLTLTYRQRRLGRFKKISTSAIPTFMRFYGTVWSDRGTCTRVDEIGSWVLAIPVLAMSKRFLKGLLLHTVKIWHIFSNRGGMQ